MVFKVVTGPTSPKCPEKKKRKLIHEAIGNKTAVLEKGMVQGQGQNGDIASST